MPTPQPTSSPSLSPSLSPTNPCNLSPELRALGIRLLAESVSTTADLNDPDSAQGMALNWITNEDAIEPVLCPDDAKLLQRYIMAVFYFGMGGGTWDQCNAPADFNNQQAIDNANELCNRLVTPFPIPNRIGETSTDAWLSPVNECFWGGLACYGDDTSNRTLCMDQIDFEADGLSGTLVSELSHLDDLRFLILEQGTTSGPIPSAFGDFESLLVLDMDFNELTGPIPEELYNARTIQQLDLNNNTLTGKISTRINEFRFLRFFQINSNLMTGTIPTEMGDLEFLNWAFMGDNNFVGIMPPEVCALRNNTEPAGVLQGLVVDCSPPDPEVECSCCSSCT